MWRTNPSVIREVITRQLIDDKWDEQRFVVIAIVPIAACTDKEFLRLVATLRAWFPAERGV